MRGTEKEICRKLKGELKINFLRESKRPLSEI